MRRVFLQAAGVLLALAVCSVSFAFTGNKSSFQAFMDLASGANHTVSFAGNGVPLVTAPLAGEAAIAGNMSVSHAAGAWPTVNGTATIPSPIYGQGVPVTVKQGLSPLAVGKALGTFALRVTNVISTVSAIYLLAQELGFLVDNSSGLLVVKKSDPSVCTVSPCYEYSPGIVNGVQYGYFSTVSAACALPDSLYNGYWYRNYRVLSVANGTCAYDLYSTSNSYITTNSMTLLKRSVAASPPQWLPSTVDEFQNAVSGQSGFPSSSHIDQALADAVNSGLATVDTNAAPNVVMPSPAQVQGAPKVTTNSDGSTTTETQTCYLSPTSIGSGAGTGQAMEWKCSTQVTTSSPAKSSTSTVVTSNPDGTTTTQTVTTTIPAGTVTTSTNATNPNETAKQCGLPGAPPCKIDESGTPAAPTLQLDEASINAQHATNKATISGSSDKGMFANWTSLFVVPPVVACEATSFNLTAPGATATTISLDGCGVVNDVRAIMAWLWALAGFYVCLGWIQEAV